MQYNVIITLRCDLDYKRISSIVLNIANMYMQDHPFTLLPSCASLKPLQPKPLFFTFGKKTEVGKRVHRLVFYCNKASNGLHSRS